MFYFHSLLVILFLHGQNTAGDFVVNVFNESMRVHKMKLAHFQIDRWPNLISELDSWFEKTTTYFLILFLLN